MALDYCNACGSIEGGTRAPTAFEIKKAIGFYDPDAINNKDLRVCEQCDSVGEISGLQESDEE